MLKFYIEVHNLLDRLREDKNGVVSFEYLIVAALIIAAVGVAYGTNGANISAALNTGIGTVVNTFTNAL